MRLNKNHLGWLGLILFTIGYSGFLFIVGTTGLYSLNKIAALGFADSPWSLDSQQLEIRAALPLIVFFHVNLATGEIIFEGTQSEKQITTTDTSSYHYNSDVYYRVDDILQEQININDIKYSPNRDYYVVRFTREYSRQGELAVFDTASDELRHRITSSQLARAIRISILETSVSIGTIEILTVFLSVMGFLMQLSYAINSQKYTMLKALVTLASLTYGITNALIFMVWISYFP